MDMWTTTPPLGLGEKKRTGIGQVAMALGSPLFLPLPETA